MTNSNLFKLAHTMTKQVIQAGDNYQATFGLCLKAIKANNAKVATLSTIVVIAIAIILNILINNKKEVKQVAAPTKIGTIIYANKDNDKTAFEVTKIWGNAFITKDLYNRKITIFILDSKGNYSSVNGYTYDESASLAWLEMHNKEQSRVA